MRRLVLVAALSACNHVLGIPDPASGDAAAVYAVTDTVPAESACNGVDDDGDGLVDQGYVYVEHLADRRTLVAGTYEALWWMERDADRVVAVWENGGGISSDVVAFQVFDLSGAPIADPVTTNAFQPWTVHRGFWTGSAFEITGTQRDYACGGTSSTTCGTYLMAVGDDGAWKLQPKKIATGTPYAEGAYVANGEYVAAFPPSGGEGTVTVKSFTSDGSAGAIDAALFTTSPGEIVNQELIRALVSDDRVYWVYPSTATGEMLRVTDLAGTTVGGPFTLGTVAVNPPQRGGEFAIVADQQLIMAYAFDTTKSQLGRWSVDGQLVGTTDLPGMTGVFAIAGDGKQIYVLAFTSDGTTGRDYLWRFSYDGRVIQAGTPITIPGNHDYSSLVLADTGVFVTISDSSVPGTVIMTKLDCP